MYVDVELSKIENSLKFTMEKVTLVENPPWIAIASVNVRQYIPKLPG